MELSQEAARRASPDTGPQRAVSAWRMRQGALRLSLSSDLGRCDDSATGVPASPRSLCLWGELQAQSRGLRVPAVRSAVISGFAGFQPLGVAAFQAHSSRSAPTRPDRKAHRPSGCQRCNAAVLLSCPGGSADTRGAPHCECYGGSRFGGELYVRWFEWRATSPDVRVRSAAGLKRNRPGAGDCLARVPSSALPCDAGGWP